MTFRSWVVDTESESSQTSEQSGGHLAHEDVPKLNDADKDTAKVADDSDVSSTVVNNLQETLAVNSKTDNSLDLEYSYSDRFDMSDYVANNLGVNQPIIIKRCEFPSKHKGTQVRYHIFHIKPYTQEQIIVGSINLHSAFGQELLLKHATLAQNLNISAIEKISYSKLLKQEAKHKGDANFISTSKLWHKTNIKRGYVHIPVISGEALITYPSNFAQLNAAVSMEQAAQYDYFAPQTHEQELTADTSAQYVAQEHDSDSTQYSQDQVSEALTSASAERLEHLAVDTNSEDTEYAQGSDTAESAQSTDSTKESVPEQTELCSVEPVADEYAHPSTEASDEYEHDADDSTDDVYADSDENKNDDDNLLDFASILDDLVFPNSSSDSDEANAAKDNVLNEHGLLSALFEPTHFIRNSAQASPKDHTNNGKTATEWDLSAYCSPSITVYDDIDPLLKSKNSYSVAAQEHDAQRANGNVEQVDNATQHSDKISQPISQTRAKALDKAAAQNISSSDDKSSDEDAEHKGVVRRNRRKFFSNQSTFFENLGRSRFNLSSNQDDEDEEEISADAEQEVSVVAKFDDKDNLSVLPNDFKEEENRLQMRGNNSSMSFADLKVDNDNARPKASKSSSSASSASAPSTKAQQAKLDEQATVSVYNESVTTETNQVRKRKVFSSKLSH